MDEIHDYLIKLQSFLHNPDSHLGPAIEDSYEGIYFYNEELQRLFNANKEYKELSEQEDQNLSWYLEQLTDIWKQLRKKKNISPQLLESTLQSLKDIQQHFEGLQNPSMMIAKLRQENMMLQMKVDCGQRLQHKENSDNQYFQRAAEEINNLKQINRQLKKEVHQITEARKDDARRYQDQLKNFKKQQFQKPFNVKQLEEENEKLRQMNLDLLKEQQNLKEQMQQQVNQISDTKELTRLRDLVNKQQQENQALEEKIQDLYDKLELGKQNDLENQVATLEKKLASHTIQMQKANEENKLLQKRIEQVRQQNQKYNEKCLEPLGIRCLPEMKGVQSHFNTVMHLLEVMTPFTQILTVTDKVSQIILKFVTYIRKETEAVTATSATQLQELLPIEMQNDNRANDFLFQIIDHLSRALTKKEGPKSQIATIIQAQDSPIYDLFFFLQRVFPIDLEIQPNEVPLINSIKHIRYFEGNIKSGIEFSDYVQGLIKLEGQENMIDDKVSDFNFLVFPNYLVLNVCELCLQKADIKLGLKLPSSSLNPTQTDIEYQLIAIVHCNEGPEKQPIYSITLQKNNQWVQICQDQAQVVSINEVMTFKAPYNDKELLIYRKSRI